MTSFTSSGARRTGDEYQDLQSAEILVQWLEQPDSMRWVRLETQRGSLDDIQAELTDASLRLLQVKFATDPSATWAWDDLTRREAGKGSTRRPSLLQKWQRSLNDVLKSGATVSEAALLTNREAAPEVRAWLTETSTINFSALPEERRRSLAAQLGGAGAAKAFFDLFRFFFRQRSLEVLESSVRRRFLSLGGTQDGWTNLLICIRRWINRKDEPRPDGTILFDDIRAAALWHAPPRIPQGFAIPPDYVPPADWSAHKVEPRLVAGTGGVEVVTGSPGAGKSTFLSWLVERIQSQGFPVVRHHYFLSLTDPTPNRAAWETAASSLIGQLRATYPDLTSSIESRNPIPNKLREFVGAAGAETKEERPLVVVVDGLDHAWRDTGSEDGLRRLFDLLLPPPPGVVVVVGTQSVDVSRIPRKLRMSCPRDRWLTVPRLDIVSIHEWLEHHREVLDLPNAPQGAEHVFAEVAGAFQSVSGGHPLLLHYTLEAARQIAPRPTAHHIRQLPAFGSETTIADYYRQVLWEPISPEGRELLYLLAAFPWSWPRNGLVQCLAGGTDVARLETAEQSIRHLLGSSHLGVTAFHESLLAFVRATPEYETASEALLPRVLTWLFEQAPGYWRWRYEWEIRARSGDVGDLIAAADLDWCVDSLASGRLRHEVAQIVSASGSTALGAGDLATATVRGLLDSYLGEASQAGEALAHLVGLELSRRASTRGDLGLAVLSSYRGDLTLEELREAVEAAFSEDARGIALLLLNEGIERWNSVAQRSRRYSDDADSLAAAMPTFFAVELFLNSKSRFQVYISNHKADPPWCRADKYAKAISRLCALGDQTRELREELRFLANMRVPSCHEAVDEVVRLACRDDFRPEGWIHDPDANRRGLLQCYRAWMGMPAQSLGDSGNVWSFAAVWNTRFVEDGNAFIELTRAYFFDCLASGLNGVDAKDAVGLDPRATLVGVFLRTIREVARKAAVEVTTTKSIGGAWVLNHLMHLDQPHIEARDFDNRLISQRYTAPIVVGIAQDLEELHIAAASSASLTAEAMQRELNLGWTWAGAWIEDRVERRLRMSDSGAAQILIERERQRLQASRDYPHTRAAEYASLARFCQMHGQVADDIDDMARRAAMNLLGHGFHKDVVLFDLLEAVQLGAVASDKSRTLARLNTLCPLVQVVQEITDGDETRHLKRTLAETLREVAPEVLPAYVRALQNIGDHWIVEAFFTRWAKHAGVDSVYEKSLMSTLVHEEALSALGRRAELGDSPASDVLAATLAYCGRSRLSSEERQYESPTRKFEEGGNSLPPIADFPPAQLEEFIQATREAGLYGDDYTEIWTRHWMDEDPDGLLAAAEEFHESRGYPHERKTGELIVRLALERGGKAEAWNWLIVYHQAAFEWSSYGSDVNNARWIWKFVHRRFPHRWLEFVQATSQPRGRLSGGAPGWSVERLVLYLNEVGQLNQTDAVIDAAVRWAASLAADMPLPDSLLAPEVPEHQVPLRLLIDRLDCPSRMVQERALQALARLLGEPSSRGEIATMLVDWHDSDRLELRTSRLLLLLRLARVAFYAPNDVCRDIAENAALVPSISTNMLLRSFDDDWTGLADPLDGHTRDLAFSGQVSAPVDKFRVLVGSRLAPVFSRWADSLDRSGIDFSLRWEREVACLARERKVGLDPSSHGADHYHGGVRGPLLAINDRISEVLRSGYLRALNWAVASAGLDEEVARRHARRAGVMADPEWLSVPPTVRPAWWPVCPPSEDRVDRLAEAVGSAVSTRFSGWDGSRSEITAYAAGPVGHWPDFGAELRIRAFLQSALGPYKPRAENLGTCSEFICRPIPPRLGVDPVWWTPYRFREGGPLCRDPAHHTPPNSAPR
jgi:hypothetical protein